MSVAVDDIVLLYLFYLSCSSSPRLIDIGQRQQQGTSRLWMSKLTRTISSVPKLHL
eukprot:m.214568 g.214568  ORF g.214568 m.214568 type:complete len:56 (+) comp16965_c0_seq6:191-358(+)